MRPTGQGEWSREESKRGAVPAQDAAATTQSLSEIRADPAGSGEACHTPDWPPRSARGSLFRRGAGQCAAGQDARASRQPTGVFAMSRSQLTIAAVGVLLSA